MEILVGGITESELVEALLAAMVGDGGDAEGLTVVELADACGATVQSVREGLARLKAEGRLEVVKVAREDLSGRFMRVPGYRILKGEDDDGVG